MKKSKVHEKGKVAGVAQPPPVPTPLIIFTHHLTTLEIVLGMVLLKRYF